MLQLISHSVASPDESLAVVSIRVDRLKLAKRRWRGQAADGADFGFELTQPLKPGTTVWQSDTARYVIEQEPEAVLEIPLDVPASAAAGIGWAVGNLHMELMSEVDRLLAIDDPAVRQLLERIQVPYKPTTAVFRPGRFVRGAKQTPNHDLGPSHRH